MTKLSLKSGNNESFGVGNKNFCDTVFSDSKTSFSAPDGTSAHWHTDCAGAFQNTRPTGNVQTISIGKEIYEQLADSLCEAIGDSSFFNGHIDIQTDCFDAVMTLSAVIYRSEAECIDGRLQSEICDIVPVWWEFNTFTEPQGQLLNDFSFSTFKRLFLNRP